MRKDELEKNMVFSKVLNELDEMIFYGETDEVYKKEHKVYDHIKEVRNYILELITKVA